MKRQGSLLAAPVILFAASMAALLVTRIGLMLAYPGTFASLGKSELLHAFVRGAKFDAAITLSIFAVPIAMLLVPWPRLAWRRAWGWTGFFGFAVLVILAAGDAIYFGDVGRHAGPEAAALLSEAPSLARLALAEHFGALVFFAVGTLACGVIWKRIIDRESRPPSRYAWLLAAAFIPLAAVTVRGGIQDKPMGVVNVFDGVSRPAGLLALPGPYAIVRGVCLRSVPSHFMSDREAVSIARAYLASPHEKFVDDQYPLLRRREIAEPTGSPPNVVVLLLEGWRATAIDSYRKQFGLESLGLTPAFDALAADGVLFKSFYANGQRSAESFSGILAGIPALPGISYLGLGMEQNYLPYIGWLAKENGYRSTLFVRGARRDSFRLDAISDLAGFDRYLGFEDIKAVDGGDRDHPWGASDERTFGRAIAEMRNAPEPFLTFVFTLSTHRPWLPPADMAPFYPNDSDEHRYLNTIRYADQQLGLFMHAARNSDWYDRTIFVLVSDHYPPLAAHAELDVPSRHRVPLLILAPGLAPAVRADPGSHLDLIPTIMDLAGWSGVHASLGRSLFERDTATAAAGPIVTGDLVSWIEAGGSVTHDLRKRVSATGDEAAASQMETRMLALVQVALQGLKANRIAPSRR